MSELSSSKIQNKKMQNHKNTKTRNIEIQNTKQKQTKNQKKFHETGEGRIFPKKMHYCEKIEKYLQRTIAMNTNANSFRGMQTLFWIICEYLYSSYIYAK